MTDSRKIVTVTQINNYIKALFDKVPILQNIWIKGEISNLKLHSSGHIYLTLKDNGAVLKAVMFRNAAQTLKFKPSDGTMVLARGRISVYEAGGQYQMYIEEMEAEGQGDLYAKFEALKKQLGDEGLFDSERKRNIPKFPLAIGIATSPTGAAVRDMINILCRRFPMIKVILYPCLVQGDGASKTIKEAIEYFNNKKNVDVIIVGRGGGSIEDLWAFNEEITARAIAASDIPIISAVGHETDFTISDFVADLRAPTPSAAAELAVPDMIELRKYVNTANTRMMTSISRHIDLQKKAVERLGKSSAFTQFDRKILDYQQTVDRIFDLIIKTSENTLESLNNKLSVNAGKLSALSPLAVFERGYCTAIKNEKILNSVDGAEIGDDISLRMKDGEFDCKITDRRRIN